MKHLLVIRFSAMGDVAMTVPVVYSLAQQYPELKITMLTQQRLVPFYKWMPKNVDVVGVNLKEYKGIGGLGRLYKMLKPYDFDAVADVHDVLRTKYLRLRFRLNHVKVAVINKGRAEKKALLGHGMDRHALKPMTERYREVFNELGVPFQFTFNGTKPSTDALPVEVSDSDYSIGVAPFAAHQGKIYPLDKMKEVVDILADSGNKIYLFGAGKEEREVMESWERDGVVSVAGKLGGLENELLLMSKLNIMISMDSSNMHMAAMMGTQTVSVWGATHPKAGFLAWNQNNDSCVQLPLDCRPCSVYGNKPCQRGDFPCMNLITPEHIVEKVRQYGAK